MVDEAEARANAAEERSREAINAANAHRDQTDADAEALLSKARREAEQLVHSAKKQAESLRTSGHADAERELASHQGRGRPAHQAPRRDRRPARCAQGRRAGFGGDEEE